MEICKVKIFDWSEAAKAPFKGKFLITEGSRQVSYIDLNGLSWCMASSDYEYFEKWFEEQRAQGPVVTQMKDWKALIPDPIPPINTTDAAKIIFQNCSGITISEVK